MSETDKTKDRETRIRELAYALWEKEGQPEGRSAEFWERARRVIEAEEGLMAPEQPPSTG